MEASWAQRRTALAKGDHTLARRLMGDYLECEKQLGLLEHRDQGDGVLPRAPVDERDHIAFCTWTHQRRCHICKKVIAIESRCRGRAKCGPTFFPLVFGCDASGSLMPGIFDPTVGLEQQKLYILDSRCMGGIVGNMAITTTGTTPT
jgi:hypothetical protein